MLVLKLPSDGHPKWRRPRKRSRWRIEGEEQGWQRQRAWADTTIRWRAVWVNSWVGDDRGLHAATRWTVKSHGDDLNAFQVEISESQAYLSSLNICCATLKWDVLLNWVFCKLLRSRQPCTNMNWANLRWGWEAQGLLLSQKAKSSANNDSHQYTNVCIRGINLNATFLHFSGSPCCVTSQDNLKIGRFI